MCVCVCVCVCVCEREREREREIWICLDFLQIVCSTDEVYGKLYLCFVSTDAMSKVEPWKEGLRRTKSVAAVYGGRGFESFQ